MALSNYPRWDLYCRIRAAILREFELEVARAGDSLCGEADDRWTRGREFHVLLVSTTPSMETILQDLRAVYRADLDIQVDGWSQLVRMPDQIVKQ